MILKNQDYYLDKLYNLCYKGINMIIAGFPCIGKTTMSETYKDVLDLSSTRFHYLIDKDLINEEVKGEEGKFLENPDWPQNYIAEILKIHNENKYKIIFILARDYILENLNRQNIDYLIAVPEEGLKREYVLRSILRGNNSNYVKGFELRYDKWRNTMLSQPVKKIYLKQGEFIEETLKRLKLYGG